MVTIFIFPCRVKRIMYTFGEKIKLRLSRSSVITKTSFLLKVESSTIKLGY